MERVPIEPLVARCATTESPCGGRLTQRFDIDAEAIESVAEHAREHTLKREFGDWDTAEHDALELIARAEQQAVMP